MSTYSAAGPYMALDSLKLKLADRFMYGSSRLGTIAVNDDNLDGNGPGNTQYYFYDRAFAYDRGFKQYELTNHLGNVLATVSDRKFGVPSTGSSLIDHYDPHIVTAQDYYPFGMLSRVALPGSGKSYRFGFNGKENDNDVKGGLGNQQDYGMRIYDARVGKFLSVDPLTKDYPWYSPYHFAGNTPIQAIDLDGLEILMPNRVPKFWEGFIKSTARGVLKAINHVSNNPNHAGYGYHPNMKPSDPSEFKKYEINWRQQLDPTWQIQNFSENLVGGASNFIGGIMDLDGERTAKAVPKLLGSVGTMVGIANILKTSPISFFNSYTGLSQLRLWKKGLENVEKYGKKSPYMITAVTDKTTGITYFGENKIIKSLDEVDPVLREKLPKKSLEDWETYNCAECDAVNKALKGGAKWENLEDIHTMRFDKKLKKYVPEQRCKNCKVSYQDKTPSSEQ